MSDNANASTVRETTPIRRWWACTFGLVAFLLSICVCAVLVVHLLHIGLVSTEIDLTRPLQPRQDNGFGPLPLLAWALSGFVSAFLGAIVCHLIAPDALTDTFRFNLIAGLVVLVGGVWVFSLATLGFDFAILLRMAVILVGGIYGIRVAAR